jgi:peptidoglycan hydrolase-like protein with peptidoglycan-binding domain
MTVVFPHAPIAHKGLRSPTATLHSSTLGLVVAIPNAAHSGTIYILRRGRRSNLYGPIHVTRQPLHPALPTAPAVTVSAAAPVSATAPASPFDGQGMWIWYISKSDAGKLASIVTQAHAAGVTTVYIKSSDGSTNFWTQFTPQLIATMHANGLKVCAWQYIYGSYPTAEADLGAQAVADGADCLVIDAEAEYEGRYGAAQNYIAELRARIGPSFPVALASFPYVDYHPSCPYSVFLGPTGAQYDLPQMYWKAIGTSVDDVYAHTWIANRIYGRPIYPLGQTYGNPSAADLTRFRQLAVAYGATGLSFWDFQDTSASGWSTLAAPLAALTAFTPNASWPDLGVGLKGDQILWMQEHLATAIPTQPVSGIFDAQTAANLASFQTAHGLPATGQTDPATWQALLTLAPVAVDWTGAAPGSSKSSSKTSTSTSSSTTTSGVTGASGPTSTVTTTTVTTANASTTSDAAAAKAARADAPRRASAPLSATVGDVREEIPELGSGQGTGRR